MLGPVKVLACEVCDQKFEAQRSHRRLCSAPCRQKRAADTARSRFRAKHPDRRRIGDVIACALCGASFKTTHPRRKYCSSDCVSESHRLSATSSYWNRPENQGRTAVRIKVQTPENKKRVRKHNRLKATYGIGLSDLEAMKDRQGRACAICERTFDESKERGEGAAHVDHNHATGHVRGILCHACNVGLGSFKDDQSNLQRAIAYLCHWEGAG